MSRKQASLIPAVFVGRTTPPANITAPVIPPVTVLETKPEISRTEIVAAADVWLDPLGVNQAEALRSLRRSVELLVHWDALNVLEVVPPHLRLALDTFVSSAVILNKGISSVPIAHQSLLALMRDEEGAALLARRGINSITVLRRLHHLLAELPEAAADGH